MPQLSTTDLDGAASNQAAEDQKNKESSSQEELDKEKEKRRKQEESANKGQKGGGSTIAKWFETGNPMIPLVGLFDLLRLNRLSKLPAYALGFVAAFVLRKFYNLVKQKALPSTKTVKEMGAESNLGNTKETQEKSEVSRSPQISKSDQMKDIIKENNEEIDNLKAPGVGGSEKMKTEKTHIRRENAPMPR